MSVILNYIPRIASQETNFAQIINIINMIIGYSLTLIYLYQVVYAIISIFTKAKKYKKAKKLHKYAYLICAHDEEKVVGNLVESILNQNYPKELMRVFVVADNCKDKTAEVARKAGATVFERFSDIKGKSWALDFAFKKLANDYDDENFEALFLFDADNLVDSDYTMHMNDMFDAGIKVGTGFRNSKNFGTNLISGSASIMFLRECAIMHHSRTLLNVGTYASGTGFYIDYKMVKEMNGWNYHTLDEDIEFSVDLVNKGIKVMYNEAAIFYDEQPTTIKASRAQRRRWARGNHECFAKYFLSRKNRNKNKVRGHFQTKYEMSIHIAPIPVFSLIWFILHILISVIYCFIYKVSFIRYVLPSISWFIGTLVVMAFIHAVIVIIKKHKIIHAPIHKQILSCFAFPIYAFIFLFHSFTTLFHKVSWVKVDHTDSTTIKEIK